MSTWAIGGSQLGGLDIGVSQSGTTTYTSTASVSSKEQIVWLSETGDYDNFAEGVKDADSFSLLIPTTNDISWIKSADSLLLGTSGDEWQIGSNNLDTPITPTNFTVKRQSVYGSKIIRPVDGAESLLFIDSVGRKVREMTYKEGEGKYTSPDLTALAEHITLSGIVDIAMQYAPDQILWCVLDNGSLVAMVYEREQNVIAWSKIPIDGLVQSVCVGGGEDEDEVWIAISRTIIGETVTYEDKTVTYEGETVTDILYVTYIEKMMPRVFTDITDAFFVDCGITFESGSPTTTITGLDHLIGETVAVLADGLVQTSKVVDENGEIELDTAASKVQVGLPYAYKLEPMRPDISGAGGTTHSSIVKVAEMGISFLNTMNAKYGTSDDKLFDINWTDARWKNNSEIAGLFTGDVVVSVDGGFSLDNNLIISGSDPLPCTIRCLVPRIERTGR
jgi:hypothetical protein